MATIDDFVKLREIDRELAMRRSVYPHWVLSRRMDAGAAERQIAIMEAIADDYRVKVEQASPKFNFDRRTPDSAYELPPGRGDERRQRHETCPECHTPEMCVRTGCPKDQEA